ncbi:unnamed protein product [Amoebophrya sp. A25]|nr:unnamed protein product [Amoebophrya sp. A25]|eukprot:GSA25T00008900001.1
MDESHSYMNARSDFDAYKAAGRKGRRDRHKNKRDLRQKERQERRKGDTTLRSSTEDDNNLCASYTEGDVETEEEPSLKIRDDQNKWNVPIPAGRAAAKATVEKRANRRQRVLAQHAARWLDLLAGQSSATRGPISLSNGNSLCASFPTYKTFKPPRAGMIAGAGIVLQNKWGPTAEGPASSSCTGRTAPAVNSRAVRRSLKEQQKAKALQPNALRPIPEEAAVEDADLRQAPGQAKASPVPGSYQAFYDALALQAEDDAVTSASESGDEDDHEEDFAYAFLLRRFQDDSGQHRRTFSVNVTQHDLCPPNPSQNEHDTSSRSELAPSEPPSETSSALSNQLTSGLFHNAYEEDKFQEQKRHILALGGSELWGSGTGVGGERRDAFWKITESLDRRSNQNSDIKVGSCNIKYGKWKAQLFETTGRHRAALQGVEMCSSDTDDDAADGGYVMHRGAGHDAEEEEQEQGEEDEERREGERFWRKSSFGCEVSSFEDKNSDLIGMLRFVRNLSTHVEDSENEPVRQFLLDWYLGDFYLASSSTTRHRKRSLSHPPARFIRLGDLAVFFILKVYPTLWKDVKAIYRKAKRKCSKAEVGHVHGRL